MPQRSKKRKTAVIVLLQVLLVIVIALVVTAAGLLGYLTITEYRPEERVLIGHDGSAEKQLLEGESYTVMSWNLGFGCLGDNADFFMDGGKGVIPSSLSREIVNLDSVELKTRELLPDVTFFQEVDINSKRSHNLNQFEQLFDGLRQPVDLIGLFANNYKVAYVPFPFPTTIGRVDSGLMTLSTVQLGTSSERISLPVPYNWPSRLGNLKRCLLVSRASIVGSEREVVFVNLHLEAYDNNNNNGRKAQTDFLMNYLRSEIDKGNYVIAGGDFNQIFSNVSYAQMDTDTGWTPDVIDVNSYGDDFAFLMDPRIPSCRSLYRVYEGADKSTFPCYYIDGFIVSSNLVDLNVETLDLGFENSDHNPVILTFTLPVENIQ